MAGQEEIIMWLTTAIGAFIGALLSLFISILIENQRKPKLSIQRDNSSKATYTKDKPVKKIKVLRVRVINAKMPKIFSWMRRDAAMHCNADIQLLHIDNLSPIFEHPISARWARADPPMTQQYDKSKIQMINALDISKYKAAFIRNIYPDSEEPIDTFVRFDDDEECYIWNNDTYFYENWRNPSVQIPKGSYYVIVTVYSSGEIIRGFYQLENLVSIKCFRLIYLSKEELQKLSHLNL